MSAFELGKIYETRKVTELALENDDFADFIIQCLNRFRKKDWGDCDEENAALNDAVLNDEIVMKNGGRLFAEYKHPVEEKWHIWIVTEAHRETTTILFPNESRSLKGLNMLLRLSRP